MNDFEKGGRAGSEPKDTGATTSSSGTGDRGHVHIKKKFSTKTFPPDTECEFCGGEAEGVMMAKDGGMNRAVPICEDKREKLEDKIRYDFSKATYKRFEN